MHSLALNVVKNHGQVANPLKSWSRTIVYMLILAQRMCNISRTLFTETWEIVFTRLNVNDNFYTLGHYSDVTSAFLERVQQLFCIIALEKKVIVILFICCVKHCKCDISMCKGNIVIKRIHNFLPAAKPNNGYLHPQVVYDTYTDPQTVPVISLLLRVMHMESKGNNITHPSAQSVFLDNIRI